MNALGKSLGYALGEIVIVSLKLLCYAIHETWGGYILYLDILYLDTFFNVTEMYLDIFVNFSKCNLSRYIAKVSEFQLHFRYILDT